MNKTYNKAYRIALGVLRNNYNNFIHPGSSHFSDCWIRDSLFSCFASLQLKDIVVVKKTLKYILREMSKEGQIPLRIGQKNILLKILGIKGKRGVVYLDDKSSSIVLDSNSLFIIIAKMLERKLEERFFDQKILERIFNWLLLYDRDKDFLIEQDKYADWQDSIKREGKVLYTNILFWKAAHTLGKKDIAAKIKKAIFKNFWNGRYFYDTEKIKSLAVDGNLLAIFFGLTNKNQSISILKSILNASKKELLDNSYPKYEKRYVFLPFFFIGMQDYHNGVKWLWLSSLFCLLLFRFHFVEWKDLYKKISELIEKENGVFEIYKNQKSVRRLFYCSERDFSWNAAFFILLCYEIDKNI